MPSKTSALHVEVLASLLPCFPTLRVVVPLGVALTDDLEEKLLRPPDPTAAAWPDHLVLPSLSKLRSLDLSDVGFRVLPAFSWRLPALTDLDLSRNKLQLLPPASSFGQLVNLTTLDLRQNAFTSLPYFLGGLPKLRALLARGNPLVGSQSQYLSDETRLFGAKANALLGLLKTCQETVPCTRVQLLLLGNSKAGKTTILRAMQKMAAPSGADRTRHVTWGEWQERSDGKHIDFTFRELPGQAEFYSAK